MFFLLLSTAAYSQKGANVITISKSEATVSEIFEEIEREAGYRLARDSEFDVERVVKLNKNSYPLDELLNIVLYGTNHSYMIANKTVIIQKPPKVENVKVVAAREEKAVPYPQSAFGTVTILNTSTPLGGATVTLSGRFKKETVTDSDGNFRFENLPTGRYNIVVSHKECAAIDGEFYLENSESKRLLFALQQLPRGEKEYSFSAFVDKNYEAPQRKSSRLEPYSSQRLPLLALKTNLLYDAMTSVNLGLEFRLSPKMTLDIPVNWKPFHTGKEGKMFRHFMVQPELRWWNEAFNGHFLGVNVLYSQYNIGGIKLPFGLLPSVENQRYAGDMYGVGLSYGYHVMLSNRFSLEFTAGLGYVYLDYDKFSYRSCKEKIGSATKHYVGPTKLGITLVFMLR